MNRIERHPILNFKQEEEICFTFDGEKYFGKNGDTIAAALIASGVSYFRITAKKNAKRSIFCGIGQCSDCFVVVDGVPNVRSCITPLKQGMKINRQIGKGE